MIESSTFVSGERPNRRTSEARLLDRIRGEFHEMRGFSPTLRQAAKLFHLPPAECARLLDLLMREGFLHQLPDGTYRVMSSD
jgi:DNA-binding IclR family transcriptional regulator